MSKANQRARSGVKTHAQEDEYKIPFKDRKRYMNNNKSKWVSKKKYLAYIKWRKGKI